MTEQPSTEVARVAPAAAEPAGVSLNERMRYAQVLAAADLLPTAYKAKPANVLLAMEYGEALGLSTITAIQQVNVIEGKPTASAQLIASLVRKAGHRLRVTGDDRHAVALVLRKDDPEFEFRAEWTVERAAQAGLCTVDPEGRARARSRNGDKPLPWETYTAAMLKARAISEVARDACPEVLAGVASYTAEEIQSGGPVDWETVIVQTEAGEPAGAELDVDGSNGVNPPTDPDMTAASAEQLASIGAVFQAYGIEEKRNRREILSKLLEIPVEEGTELTEAQARRAMILLGEKVQTGDGASLLAMLETLEPDAS